jgi:cellulose synthase/poly-beta-1,6-N-acetylglucosamine synthase-like glycosyltransferase
VEVLANAHRLGYKIVEAPVELNFGRVLRQGRMTLADLWNTGWDTLAIYYRMYALHYYDRPHLTPSQFPTVSIVIVATGAEPALKECVEACLHQDYPSEFEVIVVANQRSDFKEGGRLKMREVPEEGKAAKRNQGLDLSRFEVLAFIDAPSAPVKNWLSCAVRNFGDPEIAAVSGPRLPLSPAIATHLSGWRGLAALFGKPSLRYCYFKTVRANETRCHLDNLIIRKSALKGISKTSNLLLAFEDKELAIIVTRKLKQVIAYDPEVIVFQLGRDGT